MVSVYAELGLPHGFRCQCIFDANVEGCSDGHHPMMDSGFGAPILTDQSCALLSC